MKPRTIELGPNERIIAVVPQTASGPGCANRVVWVHIVDSASGKHRKECLQQEELANEMNVLFRIGEEVCWALRQAVPTKRIG